MSRNQDEEIPYRSPVPEVAASEEVTTDEVHFDTLKIVQKELHRGLNELDKWHAFDLTQEDGLNIEQQILAHKRAFDLLLPIVVAVDDTIKSIDAKYREK